MEILQGLASGFSLALQPMNLLYALVGCIVGTITGILPGIGPLGAMAILLSFTLSMDATGAMILFAGIYYGAMYGGSTTSILLNIPGEAASVVTCIDGYKMAQKGRAGAALTVAAVGLFHRRNHQHLGAHVRRSFPLGHRPPVRTGGIFRHRGVRAGPLGPPQRGLAPQSFIMILVGMALGTVGVDFLTGTERFTFGNVELGQGIDFLPVAMGIFGIAEVLTTVAEKESLQTVQKVKMQGFAAHREGMEAVDPGDVSGILLGFRDRPGPGPLAGDRHFRIVHLRKEAFEKPGGIRGGRHRGRCRARRRQTMPPSAEPMCPSSPWESPSPRPWRWFWAP